VRRRFLDADRFGRLDDGTYVCASVEDTSPVFLRCSEHLSDGSLRSSTAPARNGGPG